MTETNIKNLPEGRTYWTEYGYSQSYPWVEVKRTEKTVTLAKVYVDKDPEWKPNIIPGGFFGHCDNQHDQTWLFKEIRDDHTVIIRKTKRGWSHKGVSFVPDRAVEFYDYNF